MQAGSSPLHCHYLSEFWLALYAWHMALEAVIIYGRAGKWMIRVYTWWKNAMAVKGRPPGCS